MTIGVPIEIDMSSITTNVVDATEVFNRYLRRNFPKNTRLRSGNDIYINSGDNVIVKTYNALDTHVSGDVVFGKPNGEVTDILSVYTVAEGELPKAPQEYTLKVGETVPFDISFNTTMWTHRYMRILNSNFIGTNPIGIDDNSNATKLTYYYQNNQDGTCNASIGYTFSGSTYILDYAYGIPIYDKLLGSELEDIAVVKRATLVGGAKVTYFLPKYLIANSTGIYMRTTVASQVEYNVGVTWEGFIPVYSPLQLKGFYFLEKSDNMKPFDGKNYSIATSTGNLEYSLKSKGDKFNSITLAGVLCDSVEILIEDKNGTTIESLVRNISGRRDNSDILSAYPTTEIFYLTKPMNYYPASVLTVWVLLTGSNIQLGNIMLAQSVDAGFTNLEISTSYKDYSVFQYDEFGNTDYTERARVSTYNAKVDVKIEDYDMTDRLLQSLGKRVVIIDGCDNLANATEDVFRATQKIGRILSYSQNNKISNNTIENIASYNFTLEEIV